MAAGAAPRLLTTLYVARLEQIRNRAGALVAHAFSRVHLEQMTDTEWADLLLSLYIGWVGTQLDAAATADSYMVGTIAANGGTVPRTSILREIYVGTTVGGSLAWDVLAATRRIVEARVIGGATQLDSMLASATYLSAEVGSDPHRIARDAVIDAAQGTDGPMIGWRRVAEPGACRFCRMLATRGAVYTSHATATVSAGGKKYHKHCRCHVEGVTNAIDRQRTIRAGREDWSRMLTAGDVPRSAQHTQSPMTSTGSDVTRHHALQLQQLQASIPALTQRLAAGDQNVARALAWQQGRVDQLLRELAAAA